MATTLSSNTLLNEQLTQLLSVRKRAILTPFKQVCLLSTAVCMETLHAVALTAALIAFIYQGAAKHGAQGRSKLEHLPLLQVTNPTNPAYRCLPLLFLLNFYLA